MLYVIYTDPSKVKFTEYIPHFLVRATSPGAARKFAAKAYPQHPLSLFAPFVNVAEVAKLSVLQPKAGFKAKSLLYFVEEGLSDETLRLLASGLGAHEDQEVWLDGAQSEFVPVPNGGRAGVIARTENRTPAIAQSDFDHPVFVWKAVSDRWPNPSDDPISLDAPRSAQLQITELPPGAIPEFAREA